MLGEVRREGRGGLRPDLEIASLSEVAAALDQLAP
jgi:hypothetical protein